MLDLARWFAEAGPDNGSGALGESEPWPELIAELNGISPSDLVASGQAADEDDGTALLAGLWLMAGDLDRSHRWSQSLETPAGSYWHGIMHRREGDFGNAKYWFRRVGRHPVMSDVLEAAQASFSDAADSVPSKRSMIQRIVDQPSWDPFAFVDAVELAVRTGQDAAWCRVIAAEEWRRLMRSSAS